MIIFFQCCPVLGANSQPSETSNIELFAKVVFETIL